MQMQPFPPIN